jgi:uncharacterized protein YecE (DUF72 family)
VADWYPKGLPADQRLPWYAEHFSLVEINSTFYGIPSADVFGHWVEQTPQDFVFTVKLHRLLSRHSTQVKMLPRGLRHLAKGTGRVELTPALETAVAKFFLEAIAPFVGAGKLGALFMQLSPSFRPRTNDLEELDHLLDLLSKHRVAIELRNRDWAVGDQVDKTATYFRKRGIAFVDVDGPSDTHFMVMPSNVDLVTTPQLAYFRAHGRNAEGYIRGRTVAERFDYKYSDEELKEIAARVANLSSQALDTYVIYNNNKSNYAPLAASRFKTIKAETVPLAGH